ncbi:hypothetical protein SAMD00019534_114020, partial [Acytostelium subglobosum LB1]|uniref:hypothetical protein n=1 Tax=Acytostelium subglobosum LB1 TaxID=1410327 RepID=UPI000644CECF
TTAPRYSGIQKQVLSLYRGFIRQSRLNDSKNTSSSLTSYIRGQFRTKSKSVSRRDISKIEMMILKGQRQLKLIKSQDMSGFSL